MSHMSLTSSSSSEGSRDSGYDGPVDTFGATNLVSSRVLVALAASCHALVNALVNTVPAFICTCSGPAL